MLASVLISVIAGFVCVVLALIYRKNSRMLIGLGIIGVMLVFYGGYGDSGYPFLF